MAVARRSLGKLSAISENAAGESAASPTPTPMRQSRNCQYSLAIPQAAVAALQNSTPTAIRPRRLRLSARRPRGMPQTV
ncbi:hypothetical protein D9M71_424420 [compost metagenome]